MKINRLLSFAVYLLIFLCFSVKNYAQQAFLIDKNVAMFVPENYVPQDHEPSLILVKEPTKTRDLPSDWKVKVEFTQAFDKSLAYIKIPDMTDLYGTGEVAGTLIRNGKTVKLWNTDNLTYKRDYSLRLYQSHPWVLGVRADGSAFGVLADNTWKQEISLGEEILFSSHSSPFRVIVIEGENPQKVLEKLAEWTGKMNLPPLWSLGFQQSRWSYFPDSRVKGLADTFRMKKIPCDAIWMDIDYMDKFKIFTFSPEKFQNPKELNDYLHAKNFKSVWTIDPGVKKEEGYFVYDSGTEKDLWVKDNSGNDYVGAVWPGDCVFPDFTMPQTAQWWAKLYKAFMVEGADGVWNDMNEPSVFYTHDWTMPEDNIHRGGRELPKGTHLRYHNIYGFLMIRATREGLLAANPNKRPFILTRSNILGGQRYAATWTGDNASTWEYLKMSIPMSLNLGLSGHPFNGSDIGGFDGNATADLYGHWIALGAFYPFSRAHTIQGSKPQEPWAFGKKIEKVARTAMERRYRLLPYIYTLFQEASVNGMPVMRPLFFADVKDLSLRKVDNEFLLGEDLLIIPQWVENPVIPKGEWRKINIVDKKKENDGYQPTVMIRPGAIVPLGNIIQSTNDYSLTELTLLINLDEKNQAVGRIYEDKGDGFGYKKGEYRVYYFFAIKRKDEIEVQLIRILGDKNLNL